MRHSITMAGVPVSEDDARNLVTTLVSDGTPQALSLADRLTTCLEMSVRMMALDPQERDTLLAVLEDPPESLAELRGKLASSHRDST
jgi:hypothetical protein